MTAVAMMTAPTEAGARIRRPAYLRVPVLPPLLFAVVNAIAFVLVRPDVSDLQAALAREDAAANGVGLDYWFQWFGGGTTPGHYSVLSPYLSSWLGAPVAGALGTVLITLGTYRACADTRFRIAATWVATIACALSLWSGRVPFALGCAAAVLSVIGVRERRWVWAIVGALGASAFSPVNGAFLAFVLLAAFITEPAYRRILVVTGLVTGASMLFVAFYFGTPGAEPYSTWRAGLATLTAGFMLLARPRSKAVRLALWMTLLASPVLAAFPNGMGANFVRLPFICLPAAAVAVAGVSRKWAVLAVCPALICTAQFTVADLLLASRPAADASYYATLGKELDRIPQLKNYRLEVVQNTSFHTAAAALISHAALASGWETQQQTELNGVLSSPSLDAVSYKVWLDNNAVGYLAFDRRSGDDSYEYQLVAHGDLDYLTPVWRDPTWTLYRVRNASPIVPAPQTLVKATQSALTIRVPCACTFRVRVRYSKFLYATTMLAPRLPAVVRDDSTGWTVMTTTAPGTYLLQGHAI